MERDLSLLDDIQKMASDAISFPGDKTIDDLKRTSSSLRKYFASLSSN